jgi:3-(3-hydroxy-phenyl)propionate hydroxylase
MPAMASESDRIIIVGAGPVGLTAALALIRRGIPITLLAAEPELVGRFNQFERN